jgi:CMP-N-acetylneuraminic acid synthetase
VTGERAPIPRRQDLPAAYFREGSVYVTRSDVILRRNSLYGDVVVGHPVEAARSVNLDGPEDWTFAEELLAAAAGGA